MASERDMSDMIGGVNAVLEALKARGAAVRRIWIAENRGGSALTDLMRLARIHGLRLEKVPRHRLDRLFGAAAHQGVVAEIGPYAYYRLEDIIKAIEGSRGLVLILDRVQDPGNLGSLIRSAEAAGAAGVIIPREGASPVTPAVMKASAGAAEHVKTAREVNLIRVLDRLKEENFWIVGAHAEAPASIYEQDLNIRLGLVIGGEGRGLRRLVREKCDLLVSIPMRGRVTSLNASVAGALAMFEYVRQTGG